jgi:TolB protein
VKLVMNLNTFDTTRFTALVGAIAAAGAVVILSAGSQQSAPTPATPAPAQQQPGEITTTISGEGGSAPRLAVPAFIALTHDAETEAIARTISQVLFDDFAFEREFALVPKDIYTTIPAATSFSDVPFARWRELNADGLIIGTVEKVATGVKIEVRLFDMHNQQPLPPSAFGKEYTGSAATPRLYAHTIADEVHQTQRALRGVARTKLTFNSDRDGERLGGTIESRSVKEIYIADYDGESQRRLTVQKSLNITPTWSPDARSIAYTSYRRGPPNIFISNIYQGTLEELTKDRSNNFTPAWSPDGMRLCFASTRDGNMELYVVNRDGSNLRRLTNHPASDITPTWSPSGTQIAFTSDRTGTPQIYLIGADGLGLQKLTSESYADRPTWSPAPYNEIAFASRTGPGFDIKVMSLATREVRQITFGEGTNESPAWAPNGRHFAFTSTRSGKTQVFVVARDGKDLKQITRTGSNYQPDWSK